jgi:hypothetical protein
VTLSDLIDRCRHGSGDIGQPPFWSNSQWADALNEAETEACIRAKLIEDDEIIAGAVSGDPFVTIPDRAFSVRQVSIDGAPLELLARVDFLGRRHGDLASATGTPTECCRIGNRLRLYPAPDADADVTIVAFCTPKDEMLLSDTDSVEPEIPARIHVKLIDWALSQFYSTPDADYFNQQKADRYEARFEVEFGPRPVETEMKRSALRARRDAKGNFV